MRALLSLSFGVLLMGAAVVRRSGPSAGGEKPFPGRFTDGTAALGVHFNYFSSHTPMHYLVETMGGGVALFDYDNDGRLDIFMVNGAPLQDPTPKGSTPQKTGPNYWNRLYHQKADGTFEDVTERAGLPGAGYGMGVAVGDYDNDGFEDLYVTAYGGNKLYHNHGDGTFTDVTEKAGVAGSGWSTSAAWGDLDNDGLLDLVVLRYLQWDFDDIWCGEHKEGYRAYCHPDVFQAISPLVYHNDGNGHFTEVSQKIGLAKRGKGLGIALADYDRDGHIDLFIANDSMVEFLYHNKGDGTFEEVGLLSEVAVDGDGRTFAGMGVDFADYNNDGWPDLIITDLANQRYALYQNNRDSTFTYDSFTSGIVRNETPTQNHWLKLKLVGHKSNRDAIGAEVRLVTSKSQQFATVSTAGSYLSSSDKRVHFGLGPESVAQSIEIRWPSGIRQTLKNVSADQILQVDEPLPGSPPAAGTSPK